jgi:hypothetical protein
VLRNAARFAGHHVRFTNRVKQRSLSVIDVTHDRDHRRARLFDVIGVGGDEFLEFFFGNHLFKWHKRLRRNQSVCRDQPPHHRSRP